MAATIEIGFEKVQETITKLLGFNCSQYSTSFVRRRIDVRLRALSITDYNKYSAVLISDSVERENLKKELSIHVTNFFRDAEVWQSFSQKVVPEVGRRKAQTDRKVYVWSAGSSTGEEALTIAITLLENLPKGVTFEIIGTDIDPTTVSTAQAALYEENQFKEMPVDLREKYFQITKEGFYRPSSELSSKISYRVADIHNYHPPKVDILFCRNTVIYFSAEAKSALYLQFYDYLSPDGYFIMGKTEILQGPAREKFVTVDPQERIYKKKAS